jgi:hypothetical protein
MQRSRLARGQERLTCATEQPTAGGSGKSATSHASCISCSGLCLVSQLLLRGGDSSPPAMMTYTSAISTLSHSARIPSGSLTVQRRSLPSTEKTIVASPGG